MHNFRLLFAKTKLNYLIKIISLIRECKIRVKERLSDINYENILTTLKLSKYAV